MPPIHQGAPPGLRPQEAKMDDAPPDPRRRPRRWTARRVLRIMLALAAIDVLLCAAGVAVGGYEALDLRGALGAGTAQLLTQVQPARDRLRVASVAFGAARIAWWPWRQLADVAATLAPARPLATIGPLLDMAADASLGGASALDGLSPVVAALHGPHRAGEDIGTRLLVGLAQGQPDLHDAGVAIARARADWSTIDTSTLPAALRSKVQSLGNGLSAGADALTLASAAPDLLGATRTRFYLLVPQNPWDLRATGGFAGTAVLLQARHGRLSLASSQASTNVDGRRPGYVSPPLPLLLYPHTSNWFYRDANWSPDFPTSAALLRYFYWLGQRVAVDGVIAFDSDLLGPLLHITGPVRVAVPGTTNTVTLTEANGVAELDRYVNVVGAVGSHAAPNTSFAGAAYRAIFGRLRALSSQQLVSAARVLDQALRQRHVLIWLPDPTLAPILARRGWDGAINPTRSDYLYVVDTNVHYNKINKRISERIAYRAVVRPDRSLLSTASITLFNGAVPGNIPPPQNNTLYEDFLRVYVPLGSRLVATSGLTQPWPSARADNKEVFAGYVRLPSLRRVTVTLTYVVPPNSLLDTNTYSLTIQKQPGTGAIPLRVTIQSGGRGILIGGVPSWTWQGTRLTDITLSASLVGGHARPIPLAYDAPGTPRVGPGLPIPPDAVLPSTLPALPR